MELFRNARGEFFHFVFVPKSLFDVLFCVVFMSCPHSVLECVEFAEGDSFLYSPNAYHHIEGFHIVGSVVLWVVYLFHIPYQMFCAKIEKPSTFRNGEGRTNLTLQNATCLLIICRKYNCKYSEYEWKNKAPARIIEQGAYSLGGNYGKGTTLSTCRVSDCCVSLSDKTDSLPIAKPSKMPPTSRMIV